MRTSRALAGVPAGGDQQAPPLPDGAVDRLLQEIRGLFLGARAVLRGAEPSVDLELDAPTLEVLADVVDARGANAVEIAERLRVDEDVVGRATCELQQLGLVVPISDAARPAGPALVPTAMGRRIQGETADAASDSLTTMLADWTLEDIETLTRLLARLNGPGRSRRPDHRGRHSRQDRAPGPQL